MKKLSKYIVRSTVISMNRDSKSNEADTKARKIGGNKSANQNRRF